MEMNDDDGEVVMGPQQLGHGVITQQSWLMAAELWKNAKGEILPGSRGWR